MKNIAKVSFLIKLAAFQASGGAHMELRSLIFDQFEIIV